MCAIWIMTKTLWLEGDDLEDRNGKIESPVHLLEGFIKILVFII